MTLAEAKRIYPTFPTHCLECGRELKENNTQVVAKRGTDTHDRVEIKHACYGT